MEVSTPSQLSLHEVEKVEVSHGTAAQGKLDATKSMSEVHAYDQFIAPYPARIAAICLQPALCWDSLKHTRLTTAPVYGQ